MVVGEASIHNIMGGMESTGGVRLHNHKRKLKQRFDIIKKLGQGTYGKVQLGINKETGQEVAIKTIKKCKIETEADLVRIRREIQIMSSVQHPNIIHIYEVFENREKMVLVMEYAAGGELYDYLSQRKVLTEEEARRIFRQIVTAVFYCHKHNICHRDLKLENILLDQIGNAKIADFGLSNVFDGKRLLNTFCGSPLYASPEIVKGISYHGPEVDCWSLGVLLYTLVYGAMPFDGSNFKRLVKQISTSDYFEPKVPSPASSLIKDMLTVCPRSRSDIQKICIHWWVNESYEKNCLHIAEELAAQTPVRLDLLLSLVPQSANADKLVVGEHQADESNLTADTSSEVIMPTRSYSADNFMEFDRSNSPEVPREITEIESRQTNNGDAKRKLDSTSSVDIVTKRKETEKDDCTQESAIYASEFRPSCTPLNKPTTENAMDVDLSGSSSISVNQVPQSEASNDLDLIKDTNKKSPSSEKIQANVCLESEKETKLKEKLHATHKNDIDITEKNVISDSIENKSINDSNRGGDSESQTSESAVKNVKKLRDKSHSLDSASISDVTKGAVKTVERRRSKIFETAEKFNQMLSNVESEKPKKIFIPGVNVGGAKRAFERKASLNSATLPYSSKVSTPKVVKNVVVDKKAEKCSDEVKLGNDDSKTEKQISEGATSQENSSSNKHDSSSKRNLIIQLAPNDLRPATVTVSTPVETKLSPEIKQEFLPKVISDIESQKPSSPEKAKKSSKMEITLQSTSKSSPSKTKKTEIMLGELKSPQSPTYKTEIEAKINVTDPRKMQTQRSEVAFPVAAVTSHVSKSSSYEGHERSSMNRREQSVPIQMDFSYNLSDQKTPLHSSSTDYSETLERQSTIDSDTDNTSKSVIGPEPIRKSPREYIIPIAVEGSNYITPRADSADIESKNSTSSLSSLSRSRFGKSRRISSLLSDASEDDESPFLSLSRDSDDLFQRHMHRLRSSRPRRQASDHADSLSSGEDDDDDGFELLTAENLFSTLLSRVRSLTQRLNVDDNKNSIFPNSRLFGRFDSNASQSFWGSRDPLSRRISESQFPRSSNSDVDRLSRKNSFGILNPKVQDSQGSLGESSKESLSSGRSNTLPRDNNHYENSAAEEAQFLREAGESLDYNFTPSLTRRLSNKFNQQSRVHVSPFNSPEKNYPQSMTDVLNFKRDFENESSNLSSLLKQSGERSLKRSTSLLEPRNDLSGFNFASLRNPESLFGIENKDRFLSPKWRSSEREYRRGFSAGRVQELPNINTEHSYNNLESNLFTDSISACDSSTNLQDSASSRSILSCESSPANSFSNIQEHSYKSKTPRNFEIRLLAAESLIKASKLKNLDDTKYRNLEESKYKNSEDSKYDMNLNSKYEGASNKTDEISEMVNSMISKRNRAIPLPRFRSSSLNREFSLDESRRKSFAGSATDKLLLPKFSKFDRHEEESSNESKVEKGQRRISRFLRPDFFDTPREESQYVKDKEAKKALENERRKSRFMKKAAENVFQESSNISGSINNLVSIIKKEWESPADDQNIDSSEKLCSTIIQQSLSSASEMEKCDPSSGDDSALYIPDNNHVIEKTDENLACKKSLKTYVKSKTISRLDVPSKDEVKPDGMRFRSKIPTKFKKNESNNVKKIADSNKLVKNPVDLSSSKVKKKENELSLLQRSKTEVKKSLEQCSKLVKKYSLENTRKIKAEKDIGTLKTNRIEKSVEKPREKSLEKNTSKNIVQVEIIPEKAFEKKQLSGKAFKEEQPSVDNGLEENGKKIVKKSGILPSLSKINSSIKGSVGDKGDKKLQKRTKVKEVKEKENDNSTRKKKIISVIRKTDVKSSLTKLSDRTKSSETSDDSKETEVPSLKKLVNNGIEQLNSGLPKSRKSLSNKSISYSNPTNELTNEYKNNSLSKTQSASNRIKLLGESKLEDVKKISSLKIPKETKRCQSLDDSEMDNLGGFYENSAVLMNKELSKSPDLSSENLNLYSFCSTECDVNNIPNEPNSSTLPVNSTGLRGQQEQESIIDRIRRKSFYSRFNDRKRKTLVSPLSSRGDMWPSMTLPKNFSFTSSKKSDQARTHNSEKRYSLYNNVLSDSKNPDRNRYSFCSDHSIPSIDSLQNYVSCSSADVPRRKNSGTDFALNKNQVSDSTIPRKKENKFQMVGHNEETDIEKNREFWSVSSIPKHNFASQCCSNNGDNTDFGESRKKGC